MSRDDATLLDIANALRSIIAFTQGHTWDTFVAHEMAQAAVIQRLGIVGEAVKRLSADFCSAHNDVPWQEIAGMRNILIHAYDQVNMATVWNVAQNEVPALLTRLEPLLPREPT